MDAAYPFAGPTWQHVRFAPYAALVARLARLPAWPRVDELDALFADHLRGGPGPAVRLVEQAPSPRRRRAPIDAGALYELRIAERGEVPTRPHNLHDLCNALVWSVFPRSKWSLSVRLAALQRVRAEGARRLPGTRSPAHDRLALLDEGGLVVAGARAAVFGHAILEHAVRGELAVRAARMPLADPGLAELTAIDRALASTIAAGHEVEPGPGVVIDDAALWRAP